MSMICCKSLARFFPSWNASLIVCWTASPVLPLIALCNSVAAPCILPRCVSSSPMPMVVLFAVVWTRAGSTSVMAIVIPLYHLDIRPRCASPGTFCRGEHSFVVDSLDDADCQDRFEHGLIAAIAVRILDNADDR